jgi:hypothetical protein
VKNRLGALTIAVMCITILLGCKGEKIRMTNIDSKMSNTLPVETWQNILRMKIFFGHQSVGFNIIDGIEDILRDSPQHVLRIVETRDAESFKTPILAHTRIGENTKPISKIDDFASAIEGGIGNNADVAFFKFCYVDITKTSDVKAIFDYYKSRMQRLEEAYPGTAFVHVTVPLTTIPKGPKAWLNKMLGRSADDIEDNIKRNEFNDMMRTAYEGKKPFFDLAKIESIYQDGTYDNYSYGGGSYRAMVPLYTTDGGHLNELGRVIVAQQLLVLLAQTII